jgi:hypothetical protein
MPPKVFRVSRFRFRYAPVVRTISILMFFIAAAPASPGQAHSMRIARSPARVAPASGSRVFPVRTRGVVRDPLHFSGRRALVHGFPFRHHGHFRFLVNACLNDPFFDPFFCRRLFLNNPFLFSEPILLPYPIYAESSYARPEEPLSTEPNQQSELNWKIDRLTDEVERLRDQQAVGEKPQQPAVGHEATDGNLPSRILVFRNGQREEIQNYAMVGDTLWILTEQRARKIPVSDLDMETTKKENGERGLQFP